jgi:hypothetical protein
MFRPVTTANRGLSGPVLFLVILILGRAGPGLAAESRVEDAAGAPAAEGLSVDAQGRLLLRGRVYRGLGVNYYDAFVRSLGAVPGRDVEAGFRVLAEHGIPFARFSAGGYWPVDWGFYRTNAAAHWERLDRVVAVAERTGVGLIPSLFWHPPTVSDLAGEPVDQWGNPDSATHRWMRDYTREVVTRYRRSPAVWAWEFGNEFNLPADLPNAAEHRPPTPPGSGAPAVRTERDDLTHAAMRVALGEFAREVRRHDPHRLILSGNAFPRPTAWHQMHERSWGRDDQGRWQAMLGGDNPGPVGTLSGRLYAETDLERLPWAAERAAAERRPLVVGEFGVPGEPTPEALGRLESMLDLLEANRVPLAALWVFDFDGQRHDWNVTAENPRAVLLKAVARRNAAWSGNAGP